MFSFGENANKVAEVALIFELWIIFSCQASEKNRWRRKEQGKEEGKEEEEEENEEEEGEEYQEKENTESRNEEHY